MTWLGINRGQYYYQVTDTAGDPVADVAVKFDPTKNLTAFDVIDALDKVKLYLLSAQGMADFLSNNR
jgi:hypothetical protein